MLFLALRVWDADGERERAARWHHLVMAVGNFKRPSGRRLRPEAITPVSNLQFAPRPDRFEVPGTGQTVFAEPEPTEEAPWSGIMLRGAGPPTWTALLAALWPERHHVLDWRVLAAASALSLGGPSDLHLVQRKGTRHLPPKPEHYAPVRSLLLAVANECGLPLLSVERALYVLTTKVRKQSGRTWLGYRDALLRAAPRASTRPEGEDGAAEEQELPPSAPG